MFLERHQLPAGPAVGGAALVLCKRLLILQFNPTRKQKCSLHPGGWWWRERTAVHQLREPLTPRAVVISQHCMSACVANGCHPLSRVTAQCPAVVLCIVLSQRHLLSSGIVNVSSHVMTCHCLSLHVIDVCCHVVTCHCPL